MIPRAWCSSTRVCCRETEGVQHELEPFVKLRERWGRAPRDRLSGAGPKPVRAAAVKSRGGERRMKSSDQTEQVRVRKTNESEPPQTRRYEHKRRRNQDRLVILGRARRVPDDWAGGDRRRGGVSRTQAFAWNCRNQTPDAKGEAQAAKPRGESTDVGVWGGPIRMSVDGPVIGSEQRDRVR